MHEGRTAEMSEKQLNNMTIDEEESKKYFSLKQELLDKKITKSTINDMISSIWDKRAHLSRLISQKSYI